MKMIGTSVRSIATRFCSSRPLRPGRDTSSTRQLGTSARGRARNSCAKANVSGSQPSERGIERIKQSRVAEWLEQALHGTLFEHLWADGRISVSGDEDDRNLFPAKFQFSLEIRSCHARHGDVQDQTPSLIDVIRREELFRRRERMGRKAQLPEQVG